MPAPTDEEMQELYAQAIGRVVDGIKKGKYRILQLNHEQRTRTSSSRSKTSPMVERTPTGEYILTVVYKDEQKTGR
jgi:hypothetical protein